jgi:hypothetical protein
VTALRANTLAFSPLKAKKRLLFGSNPGYKNTVQKIYTRESGNGTRLADCVINTTIKLTKLISLETANIY